MQGLRPCCCAIYHKRCGSLFHSIPNILYGLLCQHHLVIRLVHILSYWFDIYWPYLTFLKSHKSQTISFGINTVRYIMNIKRTLHQTINPTKLQVSYHLKLPDHIFQVSYLKFMRWPFVLDSLIFRHIWCMRSLL